MIILETTAPVTLHRKTGSRKTSDNGKALKAGAHKVSAHKFGYTVKGEADVTIRVPADHGGGVIAELRHGRDPVDHFEVRPDISITHGYTVRDPDTKKDVKKSKKVERSAARTVELKDGLKLSFFERG